MSTKKSFSPQDYSAYKLSTSEWIRYTGTGLIIAVTVAYVFYRSIVAGIVMSPLCVLFPLYKKGDCKKKRDRDLSQQFREGITAFASSLSAGYSMENAMMEASDELKMIFGEENMMSAELEYMNHLVSTNTPMETAWEDFAARSANEDIENFATVISVAKRTGGDYGAIITRCADVIGDKIRIEEDILTSTAGKRFEQKIMNMIPLVIVLYVDLTSPGFFDVMYKTTAGRIIMTACLLVYAAAILLSRKMLDIEV